MALEVVPTGKNAKENIGSTELPSWNDVTPGLDPGPKVCGDDPRILSPIQSNALGLNGTLSQSENH